MSEMKTDEYGGRGRVVVDPAKLQGKTLSEELEKIGIVELSNCNAVTPYDCWDDAVKLLTGAKAAIAERDEQLATERELHKMTFKAHQDSIAERDATIAQLRQDLHDESVRLQTERGMVAELRAEVAKWIELYHEADEATDPLNEKIAALQAKENP